MWQTIEYKAAAIEQFRKGDLLQRSIEDVQSEAANAAEMKAAASGNPLILMQVQLASDLRKLEALYSQYQRSQHRMRDSLKMLASADARLAKREENHALDSGHRDSNTDKYMDSGKERIRLHFFKDGKMHTDKDSEKLKGFIVDGVKESMKVGKPAELGQYRGFTISARARGQAEQFSFTLKGRSDIEYAPENLVYSYDENLSLSGFFQRIDNFLDKGMDKSMDNYRENTKREKSEMETIKASIDKPFGQFEKLALVRENHSAVIRELQRMQDEPGYVSEWKPRERLQNPAKGPTSSVTMRVA